MYSRLAHGKIIGLSQMCRYFEVILSKQRQHLCGSHFRNAIYKVLLACGLTCLCQNSCRASHVSSCKFHAGKKHLRDNESINHSFILPYELKALLSMLLSCIQVIPFVEDTCQTKMHFTNNL